jgi:hypothetical protein
MKFLSSRLAPIVACLTVILLMIIRVIFFYNAPDSVLIGVIPDDAFYYMQMARHRAFEGVWTFDGTSTATGFHFLYGYFLVLLYSIFGEIYWRQLYLIIGVASALSIGLAAYLVSRSAEKIFGRNSILLAVAPFFTSAALIQSTAMMESWLVILFSAATIYFSVNSKNPSLFDGIALIILGVLGSLSRTDYGMLPGTIFSVFLISYPLLKNNGLKRSGFVLAGAAIGVAIVLMHNLYISGHIFQASAQTKLYWSSIIGRSISPAVNLEMSLAIPYYDDLSNSAKIVAILCSVCIIYIAWRKSMQIINQNTFLPALLISSGCLLTVFAYIIFYRYNSESLQIWYSANFIAPTGILLAAIGFLLFRDKMVIPSILLFCAYAYICIPKVFFVPWPHQAGMLNAGLFLKEQKPQVLYGSWNAGIISYFSGVDLINIDGLTNDEVLPFIKSNTLFDYIKYRGIDYLIDYEAMLNIKYFRIKGGYLDERFYRCLRPLQAVDGDSPKFFDSRIRVFKVIRDCG